MDLDKDRISGIVRQARYVFERADLAVKESQSKQFPHHNLNDAQRIFAATIATQSKQLAGTALELIGLHAASNVASIDALVAAGDYTPGIETFMTEAAKFLGTHAELLFSARVNAGQLLLRTAVEVLNRATGVLEQSESISGVQVGRGGGLWKK